MVYRKRSPSRARARIQQAYEAWQRYHGIRRPIGPHTFRRFEAALRRLQVADDAADHDKSRLHVAGERVKQVRQRLWEKGVSKARDAVAERYGSDSVEHYLFSRAAYREGRQRTRRRRRRSYRR